MATKFTGNGADHTSSRCGISTHCKESEPAMDYDVSDAFVLNHGLCEDVTEKVSSAYECHASQPSGTRE